MKTMRWLISNFFLILLIVAVIYGYMFWGNLAGKDTPAGEAIAYLSNKFETVDRFVAAVKEKQARLSGDQPASELSTEYATNNVAEPSVKSEAKKDTGITEEQPAKARTFNRNFQQQPPVTISYSHNQTRVIQNSAGDRKEMASRSVSTDSAATSSAATDSAAMNAAKNENVEQKSVPINNNRFNQAGATTSGVTTSSDRQISNSQTIALQPPAQVNNTQAAMGSVVKNKENNRFVPTEIEQRLNNVDRNGKLTDHSLQSEEVRAVWIKARKSFYQRKYALSEQSYQKVIDDTEDNFDAYGELGNVYFNQGKKIQAAAAYYEAAAILIRKGQVQRAKSLMGLMRHLDKTKAVELQKLLDSVPS